MKLTFLGHSAFRLETADATILIDPFLTGNPSFAGLSKEDATAGVTHILLTHGHADHLGDTIDIAKSTGAVVLANADLAAWLGAKGVENLQPGNTGGTVDFGSFTVTFTNALHSSAFISEDGVSHALGNPNGLILHIDDEPSLYHMGDTDIFADMGLINELHAPAIGLVPVGDRFTMGGAVAALACKRYFNFDTVIPIHYGTFPMLEQTPEAFVEGMSGSVTEVKIPKPGETLEL